MQRSSEHASLKLRRAVRDLARNTFFVQLIRFFHSVCLSTELGEERELLFEREHDRVFFSEVVEFGLRGRLGAFGPLAAVPRAGCCSC